jgi:hypothetical protein
MNGVHVLLQSFDHALSHRWESFDSATEGLTEEQSAWQHTAYSHEPHDQGVGRPGTVLWFLNHLILCHRYYSAILRNRPNEKEPESEPPGELSLNPALAALKKANADLRAEIARLGESDLEQLCTQNKTTAEFVHGVVRHIAWHSGQIATIRRLHRSR